MRRNLTSIIALSLLPPNGKTVYTGNKIGFRKVEIKNAQLLVNGMPVNVHGVDRHEHDAVKGHVPVERINGERYSADEAIQH